MKSHYRSDVKLLFKTLKRLCDERAKDIIEVCFAKDEKFALEILVTKSKSFFNYSPLELATEDLNRCRQFISSSAVKRYVDRKWYGEMSERHTSKAALELLFLLLTVCPILIFTTWFDSILMTEKQRAIAQKPINISATIQLLDLRLLPKFTKIFGLQVPLWKRFENSD
ncbi:unnamed protein product [Didymodactylos carnosus]|uniref:Uncharacterized protein n=2 Tax=Didymodactylos carnosus TaxID=1234261 RepID=A0A814VLC5_9BILA|nr:unnamed protein product [Didymodactylos carnosus]CAF3951223.1 unnamed protein product [Didymodactylos carnosus]